MVTYYLFTDGTCAGGNTSLAFSSETVAVDVESTPLTLGAGTYSDRAVYSGNANYLGSTSDCQPATVKRLATRTPVFWATHLNFTTSVWNGMTPAELDAAKSICGVTVTTIPEVMGALWSSATEKTNGSSRPSLAQARIALLQEYVAAVLNRAAFGTEDGGTIAAAQEACGPSGTETCILAAAATLRAYNEGGNLHTAPLGVDPGPSDPKSAQARCEPAGPGLGRGNHGENVLGRHLKERFCRCCSAWLQSPAGGEWGLADADVRVFRPLRMVHLRPLRGKAY